MLQFSLFRPLRVNTQSEINGRFRMNEMPGRKFLAVPCEGSSNQANNFDKMSSIIMLNNQKQATIG